MAKSKFLLVLVLAQRHDNTNARPRTCMTCECNRIGLTTANDSDVTLRLLHRNSLALARRKPLRWEMHPFVAFHDEYLEARDSRQERGPL